MKKKVLIIVALIVILGVSLFILTGCGNKNEGSTSNNSDTTTENSSTNNSNSSSSDDNKYFDTSKFDKTKFSGVVYDKDGNSYNVSELIANDKKGYGIDIYGSSRSKYYFIQDIDKEKDELYKRNDTNKDLEFIKEVLGDPTCYYDIEDSVKPCVLVYDYDDYVLNIKFFNVENKEAYVGIVYFYSRDRWTNYWKPYYSKTEYKLYGTEVN